VVVGGARLASLGFLLGVFVTVVAKCFAWEERAAVGTIFVAGMAAIKCRRVPIDVTR
jgi:lysylphosphatidylglycerol synthetase-like protein (DUF2156 family)